MISYPLFHSNKENEYQDGETIEFNPDDLTLEERMFYNGSQLKFHPVAGPLSLPDYNRGLELFKIWNFFGNKQQEELKHGLKSFEEVVEQTLKGELGNVENFPPHDEWMEKTYDTYFTRVEKLLKEAKERHKEIQDHYKNANPQIVASLETQSSVIAAFYRNFEDIIRKGHEAMQRYEVSKNSK